MSKFTEWLESEQKFGAHPTAKDAKRKILELAEESADCLKGTEMKGTAAPFYDGTIYTPAISIQKLKEILENK